MAAIVAGHVRHRPAIFSLGSCVFAVSAGFVAVGDQLVKGFLDGRVGRSIFRDRCNARICLRHVLSCPDLNGGLSCRVFSRLSGLRRRFFRFGLGLG